MAENDGFILDDSELQYPAFSKVCSFCKYLIGPRVCQAFPEIPLEIWLGENPHTEPFLGDNGITFDPVKEDG